MGIKDDVIYVREHQDEDLEDYEDCWNDTALVKAYERAISLAKEKISLQTNGDIDPKSKSEMKSETSKESKKGPKEGVNSTFSWKVGSYCRAIYSVDGLEYEATITRLMPGKGKCIVRYLGYNNEEEVEIDSLKPSRGERVRQCQKIQSKTENGVVAHEVTEAAVVSNESRRYAFPGMIPPPPPMTMFGDFPVDESEAFSSMLMAWYMNGYHTGYYQGLMRRKMMDKSEQSTVAYQEEMTQ